MSFQKGDEVVCVDDRFDAHVIEMKPRANEHYTVRVVEDRGWGTGPSLLLREIVNQPRILRHANGTNGLCELAFKSVRFRKIDPRAIEIFRAMTKSKKPLVEV